MSTLVIGHQNPDTDAICSAIAYAELLRRRGKSDLEAACCGELSARTAFALSEAGVPVPRIVLDVRPTAGQVCTRHPLTVSDMESIYTAMNTLRAANRRSLPVVDAQGKPRGLLSVQRALDLMLPEAGAEPVSRPIETSLSRIASVLNASFQHAVDPDREESLHLSVAAYSAELFTRRVAERDPRSLIIVAGDRPAVQLPSVELGVRALALTGGNKASQGLLEVARARGVTIFTSPYDTATTTLLINCSPRVTQAMSEDVLQFTESTPLAEVRIKMAESVQPLFPVIDEQGLLLGVISRSDLVAPQRTKLVLVDHNELAQAVHGVDEADIVEVLDHHRVGGSLSSREPIRFVNEPVGSTCTLVAREWSNANLRPDPPMALCMAAGIISDTLNLTSPTATELDRSMLAWLAECSGRDLSQFAETFFSAGSALTALSPSQAIRSDCKDYTENGWRIFVGQIEEQSLDTFWKMHGELSEALDQAVKERGYDLGCLLVTDITNHHSILLVRGRGELGDAIDYPRLGDGLYDLPGIVSRKKQLLPHLVRVMLTTTRREL